MAADEVGGFAEFRDEPPCFAAGSPEEHDASNRTAVTLIRNVCGRMCLTRRSRFALRADTDPYPVRWEFVGRPSAPPSLGQGRGRSGGNDGLVSIDQLLQPTNSASITMTIRFTEKLSHPALAPSFFDERARRVGDWDSVPIPITVPTAATSVWMLAKYCFTAFAFTAFAIPLAMTCWPCGQRTTVYH